MSNPYYDGTKILSLMDSNGNKPEIYIITSNRTAGKTTFFSRYLLNKYIKCGEKFALLYRYSYELDDCTDKFFKDVKSLFFPDYSMEFKKRSRGMYADLYLKHDEVKQHCGYAITLNSADFIKKNSHLFSDIQRIMFDEFQSETNHYCENEVVKFQSLHTSIARGQSQMVRYVPVIMISNPVSLINPYYVELGISHRLTNKVKFLKGVGFVLEQGHNSIASKAQAESGFNQAFSFGNSDYTAYAQEGVYLNDNLAFIERPKGKNRYIVTLKYEKNEYAIREFPELGIIYCDDSIDITNKNKLAVTVNDHDINYIMLQRYSNFISQLRYLFERGAFRFKNLKCKEAIMKTVAYY